MKEVFEIAGYKVTRYVFGKGEYVSFKVRPAVPSIGYLVKGSVLTLTDSKVDKNRQFISGVAYTPDYENRTMLVGESPCVYLCIRPIDYEGFTVEASSIPIVSTDLFVGEDGSLSESMLGNPLLCVSKVPKSH